MILAKINVDEIGYKTASSDYHHIYNMRAMPMPQRHQSTLNQYCI
jgi:hypothetical protein